MSSTFWKRNAYGSLTDTGLTAGPHTYLLKVTDPDGNWVKKSTTVTVAIRRDRTGAVGEPRAGQAHGGQRHLHDGLRSRGASCSTATPTGALAAGSVAITQNAAADVVAGRPAGNDEAPEHRRVRPDGLLHGSVRRVLGLRVRQAVRHPPDADPAGWPGVWSTHQIVTASPKTTFTFPANTSGRYVMIRHGNSNYLSLADVQVTGTPVAPPVVDTLAPTVPTAVAATQAGSKVNVTWAAVRPTSPIPVAWASPGTGSCATGTTQWFVPAGTLAYTDATATPGQHRYEVHSMDLGGRIGSVGRRRGADGDEPQRGRRQPRSHHSDRRRRRPEREHGQGELGGIDGLPDPGGVGVSGYWVVRAPGPPNGSCPPARSRTPTLPSPPATTATRSIRWTRAAHLRRLDSGPRDLRRSQRHRRQSRPDGSDRGHRRPGLVRRCPSRGPPRRTCRTPAGSASPATTWSVTG